MIRIDSPGRQSHISIDDATVTVAVWTCLHVSLTSLRAAQVQQHVSHAWHTSKPNLRVPLLCALYRISSASLMCDLHRNSSVVSLMRGIHTSSSMSLMQCLSRMCRGRTGRHIGTAVRNACRYGVTCSDGPGSVGCKRRGRRLRMVLSIRLSNCELACQYRSRVRSSRKCRRHRI